MRLNKRVREKIGLLRSLPWGALAPALLITALGVAFIYSASTDFERLATGTSGASAGYHTRQLGYALIGVLAMLAIALAPTRWISSPWPLWLGVGLMLLGAVFVFGRTINGAKSWISLGPINLQPSELCKPLLVLALAGYLKYHRSVASATTLLACIVITGLFFLPVLTQPDFGTAMVFLPMVAAMIWVAGGRKLYLGLLAAAGALALPSAYWLGLLRHHQMRRIDIYLSSLTGDVADRSGDGYQIVQSMTAIGSGGLTGKGFGAGTQSQLAYLPERHTDFIFAVIAEETGLLGAAMFLGLMFMMLVMMLRVARATREPFARLVVVGVAAMFFSQAAINIGMACGLMPVTGITLPLVSYGGSSLLSGFIALGLVANVAIQPQRTMGKATF